MTIIHVGFSVDLLTLFFTVACKEFFIFWRGCPADFHTSVSLGIVAGIQVLLKHRIILNLLRHQPSGRFLNENLLSFRIVLSIDLVVHIPSHFAEFCSQASGLTQISLNSNFFSLSVRFVI